MGHQPDPAADAERLRGLIRDAHAAVKDLRAAIRETAQLREQLAARFEASAAESIKDLANWLQAEGNRMTASLNASVEAARADLARRLFDARIQYDKSADNFVIVFGGAMFDENEPLPYPERIDPR